jgi:hypothetical protein
LKSFGNVGIGQRTRLTSARGYGCQCEQPHLPVESFAIKALFLDPALVLVLEIVEILQAVGIEDLQ